MENNSELNNRAAQYTLCFNAQCSKAESCLRHSMTQYNTAQNARLSVINPLCYPAASYLQTFSLLPVSQSEAGTHSETTGMYPPSMQKAWLE